MKLLTACLLFLTTCGLRAVGQETPAISFNRDVRPILADKCFHCHGPDANHREAALRLDVEASAVQNRNGHAAVVKGNAEASELISRILSSSADTIMPPADSGRTLSSTEKRILTDWIRQGAHWQTHWSFVSPQRPELPQVNHTDWPRNAIDRFVLSHLERRGLTPAAETDRAAWLRRATLDLTGLPPTIAELDAFLADSSHDAYERVVDGLLASPRFGEHMAVTWLDAARYADTDGYQNDGPRDMWRWRDWVIDAYNTNMPFDQFTIEQLAGDLLPDATLSQKIATGFNRNHRYNSEAGLVLEEFLLENAVDRVDTTSTVWLGLTMGCARCHDHKYDPFSQREYYQLISFFDNITECGRAIKFGNSEPWIIAPTDAQQEQLDALDAQLDAARNALLSATAQIDAMSETQLSHSPENTPRDDTTSDDVNDPLLVLDGLQHSFRFEDMQAEGITIEQGQPVLRDGLYGNAATVGGNGTLALGTVGDVQCHTRSSISFWLKPERLESGVILSRQSAGTTRPGFTVELRDGHLQFFILTRWVAGVGAVETSAQLAADQWVHVTLTNDGTQRAAGMQIWIDGQQAHTTVLYNTNSNTGGTAKNAVLRIGGGVHGDHFKGQIDELCFFNRTLFEDEIGILAQRPTIAEIRSCSVEQRTPAMSHKLRAATIQAMRSAPTTAATAASAADDTDAASSTENAFSTKNALSTKGADGKAHAAATAIDSRTTLVQLADRFAELRRKRIRLLDSFPTTMVMEERSDRSATHVRIRGVYDALGDEVRANVPLAFPPLETESPPNRLGFAQWLVNGRHPLTARVAVNRDWQRYFGTGLVKTAEDFGLQGELPSHPDLLDWLAVEFVESGWNVKHMQKLIVLSATYRQASGMRQSTDIDGHDVEDPENRLLSRGPRLRLSARQLRDQALFVSALMTPDIGGPSVSPYQPAGLWDEMSNMTYKQSKGPALYRRGLYTLWKRTVAPPSLAILDAADRENCVVRSRRTNTPLQALTLLNETTFVEAARHLAVRVLGEAPDDRLSYAFRTVTSRSPAAREVAALNVALQQFQADFAAAPDRAKKLLAVGDSPPPVTDNPVELAAWTMLCNVLFNLDEVLTKQ